MSNMMHVIKQFKLLLLCSVVSILFGTFALYKYYMVAISLY